jgi:digeranylgeranylglycerophospholipid reductase
MGEPSLAFRRGGIVTHSINPQYDVVVVGAGPAGSITARNLARNGYAVLLCEKRPVVGVPVRCGEATGPTKRVSDFTTVDEAWIETRFTGVVFHGPENISFKYDAGRELGIMLDRRLFDQHLAREAENAGAHLRTDTRVTGIGEAVDGTRVVTLEHAGTALTVKAKMVVGADGAESLTGRLVGLKTRQLPPGTCTAIELRIRAQDPNPDCLTFWSGHDSINKGYVWAFPKVKSGVVNLGSGELIPKLGAKTQLQISTEYRDKYYPGAPIEEVHGGCVPVSGHMRACTADRFALVGDAAHHTNPLTGGGIVPGMLGGEYLSAWIDKGFKAGTLTDGFLKGYEQALWERNGRNHLREMRMRDFITGLGAKDQATFYRALKGMVDGKFSLPSKIFGFSKMGVLGAKNFGLLRQTVLAKS